MIEQRHLTGTVIRVYDPPLPLEDHQLAGGEVGGHTFRDFDATKVDIAPDGTMTLSRIRSLGMKRDLARGGQEYESFEASLLAVIDADGHLRAETIHLADPDAPRLD